MEQSLSDSPPNAASAPTPGARGASLQVRVTLLVIASVLPLLIFILASQYLDYKKRVEDTGQRSVTLTRTMAQVVEQRLLVHVAALQVLALSPTLQNGDFAGFRTRAEGVVAQQFPGANIILLREDGQQLINTLVPIGMPLPVRSNLESTHQVFATGKPAVSNLFTGAVGNRQVVSIDVPVMRNGQVAYVLSINPRLDDFADAIRKQRLPESWVAVVADRRGVVIARTLAPEKFVGHEVSPGLLARIVTEREGSFDNTSLEGNSVLTSFSHGELFGWGVAVGVPQAELLSPALAALRRTLVASGLVLVISLAGSLLLARQVTHPMAQLRQLALSVDKGEWATPRSTGLKEADDVIQALVGAAVTRAQSAAEEKRALAALRESEDRLRQSQKMEAVGQLTGGLAHDFNNLLLVIIGNLDLLRQFAGEHPEIDELAGDALAAAQRGADLTRSLLAFSRRQPLRPQRIDINELVVRSSKLLSRTLGEQIEIKLDLPPDVWPVLVDPTQLQAVLTNLATNARDAMPKGGRLIMATANRILDETYAANIQDVVPGEYVMLEVSDTGTGMTPDILNQIFEPFFTTKPHGQGTGLGLSMVFGFVKQSGGHINVYSEPGKGTTFRLYLPRNDDGTVAAVADIRADVARGRGETILVVEDNEQLRRLVTRQVERLGYATIEAANAEAALELLETGTHADLIFTDIVMGGRIDGLDLAHLVADKWPEIKVVLTSGFPAGTSAGPSGRSLAGVTLLSKPYRNAELARVLRDALDQG